MYVRNCVLTLALAVAVSSSALAEELYYNGFDYADTAALQTDFVNTWGDPNVTGVELGEGLSWAALDTQVGGSATFSTQTESGVHSDVLSGLDDPDSTARTIYISTLIMPAGTNPTGGWGDQPVVLHLNDEGKGNGQGISIGLTQDNSTKLDYFMIGVESRTDRGFTDPTVSVVPHEAVAPQDDTTYLMLAKFEFSGSDTVTGSLKILNDPDAALPTEDPVWDVVHEDDDIGWPLTIGDYSFNDVTILRHNTILSATFDEVRIGTTLADVLPGAAAELLAGDANGDGQVDGNDLISVEENFGDVGDPGIGGDANGDGQVDGNDLISVEENFGATSSGGVDVVPEPATMMLLGLGGLALLRRK